jgi:hypothetical protein
LSKAFFQSPEKKSFADLYVSVETDSEIM